MDSARESLKTLGENDLSEVYTALITTTVYLYTYTYINHKQKKIQMGLTF